jgi:hypothetical protein
MGHRREELEESTQPLARDYILQREATHGIHITQIARIYKATGLKESNLFL